MEIPVRAPIRRLHGEMWPPMPIGARCSSYAAPSSENKIISGNPNVTPEKARTVTIGTVFRSPFTSPALSSMTATVDYYKIALTDTIGVIDSVTVYQNCFNYNGISNPTYDPNNSF